MKKEIVAARIGSIITNNHKAIVSALEQNQPIEWLDRKHMQMMDMFDLGIRWHNLAIAPTLFIADYENNTITAIYSAQSENSSS